MSVPTPREVGERMRAARRAAGMRQIDLAEKVGVQRRAIYEWERGDRLPGAAFMPALADALGVSATFLLYGVESASEELRHIHERIDEAIRLVAELGLATSEGFAELRAIAERLVLERADNSPTR